MLQFGHFVDMNMHYLINFGFYSGLPLQFFQKDLSGRWEEGKLPTMLPLS